MICGFCEQEHLSPSRPEEAYALCLAALRAALAAETKRREDAEQIRMDVEKVLDGALGGEEDDGIGEGIVPDVQLLTMKYAGERKVREDAEAHAAALATELQKANVYMASIEASSALGKLVIFGADALSASPSSCGDRLRRMEAVVDGDAESTSP